MTATASRQKPPTLKQLQTQLRQLKEDCEQLVNESKTLNTKIKTKRDEIATVEARIVMANLKITVSEHAVLRYLERVQGIDISSIKETILNDQIKEQIQTLGNGVYPNNGFRVRVKNNVIVTVINHDHDDQ
jgi:chromosome segregation ATPase